MSSQQQPHILIIGAGLTGLIVAHGLRKHGIPFTIFETEDGHKYRAREWTMGLHWSLPLLAELLPEDMMAKVATDGAVDPFIDYSKHPNNGAYIYDGVNGEILKDLAVEDRIVRVSRRKLRKLLQQGLDISYSHTLESTSYDEENGSVTATFTNGSSYTGSMLLGADGPRSAVRAQLFAHDPEAGAVSKVEGIVNQSLNLSYNNAELAKYVRTIHPVWALCIHPDCHPFFSVQDIQDENKPEDWKFYLFVMWRGEADKTLDQAGRMKLLKERGAKLAEPWRTAILSAPEDIEMPYYDMSYWIARPWDTHGGLVTLAGDAAHPMPPYRGQGLNHAIQDCYNFVESVRSIVGGKANRAETVSTYSDEVAARGAEETKLSLRNGRMMVSYSQFKDSPYSKQGLTKGTQS